MDFGVVVGLDGLEGSASAAFTSTTNKHKWYGSEFLKQERSGASCVDDEDDWRTSKLAKTAHHNYNSTCKADNTTLLRSDTTTLFSSHQHQMLSFSFPNLQHQNATFPNYSHHPFSAYNRNTSTGVSVRGPFTPSQWMELEHQALIFKYISANVPIPSNLLIPIRKALDSAGFSTFVANLLRPNTFGWGSFHYGFSGNTDPEPGRCRRTDGKKWRCSRDAVADLKYCERHINRGRHRSRKPVEPQTKHLNNNNIRMYMKKEEVVERMQDSKENPLLVPKQRNPFDETSRTEFGHVSSDSLPNPSNKSSTLMNCHARDWPNNQPELSISREFDPIHTGFGVGSFLNREANRIPISWESSTGGPLGEVLVLHNPYNTL